VGSVRAPHDTHYQQRACARFQEFQGTQLGPKEQRHRLSEIYVDARRSRNIALERASRQLLEAAISRNGRKFVRAADAMDEVCDQK
jgi:hypothetical protein